MFMNSFHTSSDTLAALARYDDLAVDGLPLEFLQNKEPKLKVGDLRPIGWPRDPSLEWCPPGHGDLYTAMMGNRLFDKLVDAGYRYAFVSNADNLGAVPDARVAGWFAGSRAPFAIEAVRRTASDRKGGHFARRKADGRIVLRETAQTSDADRAALQDLDRHRFCSTNNLWFDLERMRDEITRRDGILGLPMIRNQKNVDPGDRRTPEVIQVETAMGAAIEVFADSRTIEVSRSRFVPVKTTNDLLVLRSDAYDLGTDFVLDQVAAQLPFVDLDEHYKVVEEFDKRFPAGVPSLKEADSLRVKGDWTFGGHVKVKGEATLEGERGRVEEGAVIGDGSRAQ
jgi:UTP--glucose-1-phosphate uridylyltransferase